MLDLGTRKNMNNQNGAVLTHYRVGVSLLVYDLFVRSRNFSFLLILLRTFSAIVSPDIVSSSNHLRYLTLECCLICISSYFMWSYFIFFHSNFEAKSIDFDLSSPKCILSLLSANQSHILQISSTKWFSILLISLC